MKNILFFLLTFSVIITSCAPRPASEEEKDKALKNAKFDREIIKMISVYERLKNFLEENAESMIAYRDSKNEVTYIRGQGLPDSTYFQKEDCYSFFEGNKNYNITNVPGNIKQQLKDIFSSIGKEKINSFTVCLDKKITIEAAVERIENGIFISHDLIWNSKSEKDYRYSLNKDTILNEKCIYRIGLTENQ